MTDLILILTLAVSGIIGYRFMSRIDGFIDRHVTESDRPKAEKKNEPAKNGAIRRAHPGMPVFFHVQR